MFMVLELLSTLVRNVFEMTNIFAEQVVLAGDPLAPILWLFGQLFIVGSVLVFGYLAVGAALREVGISLPSIGETARR